MSRDKLQAKAEKAYKSVGGRAIDAIPWTTIFEFLQAMLGNCPASSIKKLCKDHPVYATGELTRHLMDVDDLPRKEAKIIASASVETIGSASTLDLENLARTLPKSPYSATKFFGRSQVGGSPTKSAHQDDGAFRRCKGDMVHGRGF